MVFHQIVGRPAALAARLALFSAGGPAGPAAPATPKLSTESSGCSLRRGFPVFDMPRVLSLQALTGDAGQTPARSSAGGQTSVFAEEHPATTHAFG